LKCPEKKLLKASRDQESFFQFKRLRLTLQRNCPIRLIITSKDIMAKGLKYGLQDEELISVILILD